MNKNLRLLCILIGLSTTSGCVKGTLGDECYSNDDCDSDYSCVLCSGKNACYFADSLTASSSYEWACTTYGSGTPVDPRYSSSNGSSNSGGSGGSYNWTYSCPDGLGGGGTLPIPRGSCESQYKDYGVAYGCNLTKKFYSSCVALYSCLGQDTSKMCFQ